MTDDTEPSDTTDEQHEDTLPTGVREGLRDATTPLLTTDPMTTTADLAPVGDRLADADVVGLGEATHGTREFFELKDRILRHLVAERDVRAVAIEAPLPETMGLTDYVLDGEGHPREALAGLGSWVWEVESFLATIEWLRAFNADRPPGDRVAFYGFGAWHTHEAVERLRDHFETVDSAVLDRAGDDLHAVDDGSNGQHGVDDVHEWIAAAERVVGTLRDHLDDRRAAHVVATSERAWTRARRYVAAIEQILNKTKTLDGFEGDVGDPTEYLRRMRREELPGRTMADNVAWVRDHVDADTLVLWAHDAHLNRDGFRLPNTDATAPNLGRYLSERHGEDYYALGFSFAQGGFQAVSEDDDGQSELRGQQLDGPLPGTLDAALHALDEPLAFVDIRTAREDERTADWLADPRPQFRAGGTFDPDASENHLIEYVSADAFDGFCFVAETTRARPIENETDDVNGNWEVTSDPE